MLKRELRNGTKVTPCHIAARRIRIPHVLRVLLVLLGSLLVLFVALGLYLTRLDTLAAREEDRESFYAEAPEIRALRLVRKRLTARFSLHRASSSNLGETEHDARPRENRIAP
jgi:hypothetical protein